MDHKLRLAAAVALVSGIILLSACSADAETSSSAGARVDAPTQVSPVLTMIPSPVMDTDPEVSPIPSPQPIVQTLVGLPNLGWSSYPSASDVEWNVPNGTVGGEHVHEGLQTSDGGYAAIGHTEVWLGQEMVEGGSPQHGWLIVKTDSEGRQIWTRVIGGTKGNRDVGLALAETNDGYIAGGGLAVDGVQKRGLVKIGFDGEILWQKTYDHEGIGAVRGIAIADNGDIVATGYNDEEIPGFIFIADGGKAFLLRTNSEGDLLWDRDLEAPQGTKVRRDADGRFLIGSTFVTEVDSGQGVSETTNRARFFLTDHDGGLVWRRDYGTGYLTQMFDFDLTKDGGFVFTGHSPSYGENWDCIVTRVSRDGEESWTKVFGQPRGYDARFIHDECYGVRQTPDGGFIVAGGSGDEYEEYAATGHPGEFPTNGKHTSFGLTGMGIYSGKQFTERMTTGRRPRNM